MIKIYGSKITCETCNKKIKTRLQYHWHSVRNHSLNEEVTIDNFTHKEDVPFKYKCTEHFCFCGKCDMEKKDVR